MITLHPGYALRHCAKCGLRLVLNEVTTVQKCDDGSSYIVRHCPMRSQCWQLDRIEEECDLTTVMPRVKAGDADA